MDKDDSSLDKIHKWMVYRKGRRSLSLQAIENEFPKKDNLKEIISNEKKLFWTAQPTSRSLEVKPKIAAKLCWEYSRNQCKGYCDRFHLCPQNLLSPKFCKSPCSDQLSHNVHDPHNKAILVQKNLKIPPKDVVHLLRSSLPRLCKSFTEKGKCDKFYCGYLHICYDHLKDNCQGICNLALMSGIEKCVLHDFGREHNRRVLLNFGFDHKKMSKKELLFNVLLPDGELDNESDKASISSSLSDVSKIDFLVGDSKEDKKPLLYLHKWLSKNKRMQATLQFLKSRFKGIDININELKENPLFWVAQISESEYEVRPKVPVRLCSKYVNGDDCSGDCHKLHLCKQYLMSATSCTQPDCVFEHNPVSMHNKSILQVVFPPGYDDATRMRVLRGSFPRLCGDFVRLGDCRKPFCGYIHTCEEYASGKFKGKPCSLETLTGKPKGDFHNFRTEHNKTVFTKVFLFGDKFSNDDAMVNILCENNDLDEKELRSKLVATPYHVPKSAISMPVLSDVGSIRKPIAPSVGAARTRQHRQRRNKNQDGIQRRESIEMDSKDDGLDVHDSSEGDESETVSLVDVEQSQTVSSSCTRRKVLTSQQSTDDLLICERPLIDLHEEPIKPESLVKNETSTIITVKKKGTGRKNEIFNRLDCPNNNVSQDIKEVDDIFDKLSATRRKEQSVHEKQVVQEELKPNSASLQSIDDEKEIAFTKSGFDQSDAFLKQHETPVEEKKPVGLSFEGFDRSSKEWEPPNEIEVFKKIMLPPFNGTCRRYNVVILKTFFMKKKTLAAKWFKEHNHTFRFDQTSDKIYLCVKDILPCYEYWKSGCIDPSCGRFHICKSFLYNKEHSGISCTSDHSFDTSHNSGIIKSMGLEPLSAKQLKILLKNRYPMTCKEFLSGYCEKGADGCSHVHICGDYVNGYCTKSHGLCKFPHLTGLSDAVAERFKENFHIGDDETFRKCIIHFKEKISVDQLKVYVRNVDFNFLKDEGICHRFLDETCDPEDEDKCKLLHWKVPFAWQFKKRNSSWKMLPSKLNEEIEKCYCDPSNDNFSSSKVNSTLPSLNVDFDGTEMKNATYLDDSVEIRRLSTISKVKADNSEHQAEHLTEWKWYWQKDKVTWVEYNQTVKSESIENVYLSNISVFNFKTDEFSYRLSFQNMQQQNLGPRYFTKRSVRRRPVCKRIKAPSPTQLQMNTPWHWPSTVSMEGGRIDVSEPKKSDIIKKFEASIGRDIVVLDVEEICNIEFHQRYQIKKQLFTKKLGASNINELELYHGTDAAVVDGICVQNFDWRRCGKNATAYGQGSYFAKQASYSHNYTIPDPSTRIRFMFIAKILAGNYTVGQRQMKLPPVISPSDPNTLYDSCVNSQYSPSIYVVFERDQCYPQYLISYIDNSEGYYYVHLARREIAAKLKVKPKIHPPSSSQSSFASGTSYTSNNQQSSTYTRPTSSSQSSFASGTSYTSNNQQSSTYTRPPSSGENKCVIS